MTFVTINQAAKAIGLPDTCLRRMQADNALPGFRSGSRFYVNLDMLIAKLDEQCRNNDEGTAVVS